MGFDVPIPTDAAFKLPLSVTLPVEPITNLFVSAPNTDDLI